jgi:hypothetical protein
LPEDKSAPTQKAFPAPVIIKALILSFLSTVSNTSQRSWSIC